VRYENADFNYVTSKLRYKAWTADSTVEPSTCLVTKQSGLKAHFDLTFCRLTGIYHELVCTEVTQLL